MLLAKPKAQYMSWALIPTLYIYIYIYFFFFWAEFPYTIFECLGACFINILNTKNILNMNIVDMAS